jgi:hypothetical protein
MKLSPIAYSFAAATFLCSAAMLSASGCVSSSTANNAVGGTDGQAEGGSTSASGGSNAGGSTSSNAGGASSGDAVACKPISGPLLIDFTYSPTDSAGNALPTDTITFGDFTNTLSGGTFVYPNGAATYALTSNVTASNWHVTGSVGDYSGLGLFLQDCTKIDASGYSGMSFVISGSVAKGNSVTFQVATAADDIPATWLNAHKASAATADEKPNFGRCTPASSQYDGTCGSPTFPVPVTATPTKVTVKWTDLVGGKPQASPTPSEITGIRWVLPNPDGVGTGSVTPYAVDITIDDVNFVP